MSVTRMSDESVKAGPRHWLLLLSDNAPLSMTVPETVVAQHRGVRADLCSMKDGASNSREAGTVFGGVKSPLPRADAEAC